MELKFGRSKKGMLFTLLTLILFILMLGELFTYVSLNISHNKLVSQLSQSSSTSAVGPTLKYSITTFLHKSMLNALSVIYNPINIAKEQSITNSNNTANEISQLITTNKLYGVSYSNNMGTTFSNYIVALENQAISQQQSVHIINGSLHIIQESPLSVMATYTALVLINNSFVNSTYLIKIDVPISTTKFANQTYANTIPPKLLRYIPITITNTQTSVTSAPFQQMVRVNSSMYKQYESSDLKNIEFFYSNGTVISSWLESGNTNTSISTIYWLKFNSGIPAQSIITIYMGFANMSTNLLNNQVTGEAPQLSTTYAQYDDGASIFNMYDNFFGTSLGANWTTKGIIGTVSVNDGLTLSGGSVWNGEQNSYSIPVNSILDAYFKSSGEYYATGLGQRFTYRYADSTPRWELETSSGIYGGIPLANKFYILSGTYAPSSAILYVDYVSILSTTSSKVNPGKVVIWVYPGGTYPTFTQWIRVRAYPPNGVMPVAVTGSIN